MAAYLASHVRDQGQRPAQDAVEQATLAIYTKPGRRLDLDQPRRKLLSPAPSDGCWTPFGPTPRSPAGAAPAVASAPWPSSPSGLRLLYDSTEIIDVGVATQQRRGLRALRRG